MLTEHDIYPYPIDEQYHPRAWMLFNAPDMPRFDVKTAASVMKHLEDTLQVDLTPGALGPPKGKYDALGSDGAPHDNGRWIGADEDRAPVVATAADKNVTDMSAAERAELRAALDAADTAHRAGSAHHSDDAGEG